MSELIRVYTTDKERLDKLKVIPREPYAEVVKRLLDQEEGK